MDSNIWRVTRELLRYRVQVVINGESRWKYLGDYHILVVQRVKYNLIPWSPTHQFQPIEFTAFPSQFIPITKKSKLSCRNSMTSNHSGRPILRRIFAATRQREGVGSTSNATTASFHSCRSISITHVKSRWIVVNGGTSDVLEFKEGYQIEEIEGAEDIPENDDDSQFEEIECVENIPANDDDIHWQFKELELIEGAEDIPANDDDSPTRRTYRFDNCHVYINSFIARGVKVNNSSNNAPRVTCMSCSLMQFYPWLTHIFRSWWYSSQRRSSIVYKIITSMHSAKSEYSCKCSSLKWVKSNRLGAPKSCPCTWLIVSPTAVPAKRGWFVVHIGRLPSG